MNDWKELKKDNLPPDILTGDYEFWYYIHETEMDDFIYDSETDCFSKCRRIFVKVDYDIETVLTDINKGYKIHYRKKQNQAPTHEQIMTKWWKDRWHHAWVKVIRYEPNKDYPYFALDGDVVKKVSKEWFVDKESSDIPPEAL